ncbi:putative Ecp7(P20) [Drepanopeziza brunnea f. sp. 'multigermtubi' MB_m1]|uniref:LysM01p n=2 Tax=Drepanopeziza brunnea f. sp. 'multigermtubi' TaxID=698441 RepID=J9XN65_9HELO|nr:putative Ecp7(P20) [Drepanopeziza brunnea f. sp. 'multigermtubi' MB_m1]AFS30719.1 LysM01p [Drepanopeziza brunnea f. sp. 'multigermtubi']EKD21831.1 putative Ecp7(P20) [Drepanopeziza brunnea f. sp. 'multigermtubi' MB_m1]
MRFNNNLLLASFFGVASAFRRSCRPDTTSDVTGLGFYTVLNTDTLASIAADFCTFASELQNINLTPPIATENFLKVPCRARKRDCSRIPGSENGYYTVVDGDNLTIIAADFCTNVKGLRLLNTDVMENTGKPTPGTVLEVPCSWN